MDKRLAKRHKRQVSRQRERKPVSEPDVRTPEQIQAAREASRPTGGRRGRSSFGSLRNSTPAHENHPSPDADALPKPEVEA
jgi:hypothetical protein